MHTCHCEEHAQIAPEDGEASLRLLRVQGCAFFACDEEISFFSPSQEIRRCAPRKDDPFEDVVGKPK